MDSYQVRNNQDGRRGLFVRLPIPAHTPIARYDGDFLTVADVGDKTKTHMLRFPDGIYINDAKPLADNLYYDAFRNLWLPKNPDNYKRSYAGLVNAADTEETANARLVLCVNDYVPRELSTLLPPVAFLVTKRALNPDDEVLWHYTWKN